MKIAANSYDEALKEAELKAEEMAKQLEEREKCSIWFFVFNADDDIQDPGEGVEYDFAVAYMREPNRGSKMGAMDLIMTAQATKAGENLWYANQLTDATDPRIMKDDNLYIGLMQTLIESVKYKMPHIKKN